MEEQRNISKRAGWCNGYMASLCVDQLSRPRILLPRFTSLIGFTFLLVQANLLHQYYVVGPPGVLSVVGNWFNFLTRIYLGTVILLTVPMLYESYEDTVDAFVEQALVEMKRQYSLLYEMVLHTIQNVISF